MDRPHFAYLFIGRWTLDCFWFGAILNNPVVNIHARACVWMNIFNCLRCTWMKLLSQMVILYFTFEEPPNASHSSWNILHSQEWCTWGFYFLHILTNTCRCCCIIIIYYNYYNYPSGCEVYLIIILIYISPVTNNVKNIFPCDFWPFVYLLGEMSIHTLCPIF